MSTNTILVVPLGPESPCTRLVRFEESILQPIKIAKLWISLFASNVPHLHSKNTVLPMEIEWTQTCDPRAEWQPRTSQALQFTCIAFLMDSKVALGQKDGQVLVVSLEHYLAGIFKEAVTLISYREAITTLQVAPSPTSGERSLLIAGSQDGAVTVWNLEYRKANSGQTRFSFPQYAIRCRYLNWLLLSSRWLTFHALQHHTQSTAH